MKLTFVYDNYDRSVFLNGILHTLLLTSGCVALSLLLGVLWALLVEAAPPRLASVVKALVAYGRMTPPLLQMYLLFFGVGTWLWSHYQIALSPILVAIWCMSYYTGAAIMSSLLEAAAHRRETQADFRLRLNNAVYMVELTAGPVKASLINVLKQSVMASAIAVPELLSAAISMMADQGNANVMMNVFLATFILIIFLWSRVFNRLEEYAKRKVSQAHG